MKLWHLLLLLFACIGICYIFRWILLIAAVCGIVLIFKLVAKWNKLKEWLHDSQRDDIKDK